MVAPRLTLLKISLFLMYAKEASFSCKMGGDRGSVSGNLRTTLVSFSTGFSSGLKMTALKVEFSQY